MDPEARSGDCRLPPQRRRERRARRLIPITVAFLIITGVLAGCGTTDAEDLQVGDCFELPGQVDVRDVTDQSCDGIHETEVLAVVEAPDDADFPSVFAVPGAEPGDAELACEDAVFALDVDLDNVPEDAQLGFFFPSSEAWDDGERTLICYITSETGFPGRVLPVAAE